MENLSGTKTGGGVFNEGGSAESRFTPEKTKTAEGHWTQHYMWHSHRDSKEGHTCLQFVCENVYS